MINVEKLEKLSCLKLDETTKEKVSQSIEGVLIMIEDIEKLPIPEINTKDYQKHQFQSSENGLLFDKEEKIEGLHLEQGMFLAPKVIKK